MFRNTGFNSLPNFLCQITETDKYKSYFPDGISDLPSCCWLVKQLSEIIMTHKYIPLPNYTWINQSFKGAIGLMQSSPLAHTNKFKWWKIIPRKHSKLSFDTVKLLHCTICLYFQKYKEGNISAAITKSSQAFSKYKFTQNSQIFYTYLEQNRNEKCCYWRCSVAHSKVHTPKNIPIWELLWQRGLQRSKRREAQ